MPHVIDSLFVEIGLDPSKLDRQQREALDRFKKTKDEFKKQGGEIEDSAASIGNAFSAAKVNLLGLFAAVSGSALLKFGADAVHAGAAVGRLSRNVGESVQTISKFQALAEMFGGSAEKMAGSFMEITDALQGWKMGDVKPVIADYLALGAAGGTIIDINKGVEQTFKDVAENLRHIHDTQGPAMGGYWQRRLGLDPGLYDAMIQKQKSFNQLLAETVGLTDAEAAAASRAEQKFNKLYVNARNWARGFILDQVDKTEADFNDPKNILGMLHSLFSSSEAKASTATAPSTDANPMASYREQIAAVESRGSGGYSAVGPQTASGDRAYGRYQVMGNNIPEWSQAAIGRKLTPEQFLADPQAQDAIFDYKFGEYVKRFGNPQDAASAWFTGRPLSGGANARDSLGTSGADYVRRFDAAGARNSSTSQSINITGPINIASPPGADGAQMARDFRSELQRRQSETFQANGGQE